MKRYGLVGVGMAAGFAAALMLFPMAHGANDRSAYRQLDLFSDAFERVRTDYVRPVDDGELVNAAIQGMVSSLDPHSSYMDAKSFADMQIQTKGEFGGLGIEVTMEDGLVKVQNSDRRYPGLTGRHQNRRLYRGDRLDTHTGHVAQRRDRQNARRPGFEGYADDPAQWREEAVRRHAGQGDHPGRCREVSSRGRCRLYPASLVQRIDNVGDGACDPPSSSDRSGPSLTGYVLDLRNNPGGLLDQAVSVSSDFIVSGEIVSTRGRRADDTSRYDAKGRDLLDGKPVIVLINGGTASASEIVAGALQDHKRATILGMTSFGKGSVQTIIPLGENRGALRLTTARYFTPSGHSIQATGIVPDIAVAQGDETETAPKVERPSEADLPGHLAPEDAARKTAPAIIHPPAGKKIEDFQLSYALDILRGKTTVSSIAKAPVSN